MNLAEHSQKLMFPPYLVHALQRVKTLEETEVPAAQARAEAAEEAAAAARLAAEGADLRMGELRNQFDASQARSR